ncbi:MAG: FecR domain-containing protein [Propionivibrio sp.]
MRAVFLACFVFVAGLVAAAAGAAEPESEWIYVMRPGDTLIGVAAENFTDPDAWPVVQARNHIADPYRIPTGTRLKIPFRLLRPDPVAAEVLLVNGEALRTPAKVADADAATGGPLAAGDALRAGDSVEVAADSNLSLRFPDGTRLLVLEKTNFVLRQAARLGDSGHHQIEIELTRGNIESNVVATPASVRPKYEIRAPALRMSVRGTHFRAAAEPDGGATRSEVLTGAVRLSGARRSFVLHPGFGSLAVAGKPPQSPRQLLPAPAMVDPPARIERLPLRFGWKPVADAQTYHAQVLDAAMNMMLDDHFPGTAARWADLPDGRYTFRVRAIAAERLEGLDAEHAFTLDARPEPPFTRSPIGRTYGDEAHFDWTAGAADDRYHFQLADDATFTRLLSDGPLLTATDFTRPLAPGVYFWRVATVDAGGEHGPFGDTVSVDLQPVPASPPLAAPEIGEEQLQFRWRDSGRGETYQVQLASTPDFAEPLLDQQTSQAFIDVSRPAAGEYHLRVRAIETDGFAGPFGAPQRFTVPAPTPWWLLLLLLPLVL